MPTLATKIDLKAKKHTRGYLVTLISIHIPCGNSKQFTKCVEHSTKSMITTIDAMFSDAIEL